MRNVVRAVLAAVAFALAAAPAGAQQASADGAPSKKVLPPSETAPPKKVTDAPDPIPAWLDQGFERRLRLRGRAQALGGVMPAGTHPVRPQATRVLDYIVRRSNFFDAYDPGFTGATVEFRHPMLDLRLVEYCLSLPTYPWCVRKHVLREALQGVLPEPVLRRPKTPLAGHPFMEVLKEERSAWIDAFTPCAAATAYINRAKIPVTRGDPDPERVWLNLRPLGLDLWMRRAPRTTSVEGST